MKAKKIIKKEDFSKYHSFSVEQLYSYKTYPRINTFNYLKHEFYIYCYLNPFVSYIDHDELLMIDLNNPSGILHQFFAYEPIYIGKAANRTSYRMNQHLNDFLKNNKTSYNDIKSKVFSEIQSNFSKALPGQPKNWKEYKDNFIIVLESFEDERSLAQREIELIGKIGCLKNGTGPLVNKIVSYNQLQFKNATYYKK